MKLKSTYFLLLATLTFFSNCEQVPEMRNSIPVIYSITLSSTSAAPGETVNVATVVTDEDGDDIIRYTWSSDYGSIDKSNEPSIHWTISPNAQIGSVAKIKLSVSDGKKIVSQERTIQII